MAVRRIVANIASEDVGKARKFYGEVLGMDIGMDHGWIATYVGAGRSVAQISIAKEGGSGTPVPDLSIEVDDLDGVLSRALEGGFTVEYGPAEEPWGVRRFYVRDPFGRLVNILQHT